MSLELNYINNTSDSGFDEYEDDFISITNKVINLLEIEETLSLSVSIVLDEEIRKLNNEYRSIDKTTDVLSFAFESDLTDEEREFYKTQMSYRELGDIFISSGKAKSQSSEYGHSLRREVCFLFTHGLLHLLGYDHQNEEDQEEMFAMQTKVLNLLNIDRS
ncbi:TPA: rRNA maturation RNase YbeY [bacterium]|nr:rRNA maturation RNase YbeY [bacterium]